MINFAIKIMSNKYKFVLHIMIICALIQIHSCIMSGQYIIRKFKGNGILFEKIIIFTLIDVLNRKHKKIASEL